MLLINAVINFIASLVTLKFRYCNWQKESTRKHLLSQVLTLEEAFAVLVVQERFYCIYFQ